MAARTVIVGAGPAGLAVAALLGQHGASYTVLERADSVAPAWRDRYDGLQLHTVRWLSALPDAPITRRYGAWSGEMILWLISSNTPADFRLSRSSVSR
jgi:cation diffusion facilitator CzcD-associated flavoprotein CzcO